MKVIYDIISNVGECIVEYIFFGVESYIHAYMVDVDGFYMCGDVDGFYTRGVTLMMFFLHYELTTLS